MKSQSFIELLKGERAELALLTTYNFEPEFFESCILRTPALADARRIVVFVDARELGNADTTRVRGINSRYLVVPMRRKRGVFHPKLTLLLGATSAQIICGSANLSRAGCTHNLELLNAIPFSFVEPERIPVHVHLIVDALAFFRACVESVPEGFRYILDKWFEDIPNSLSWISDIIATKPLPDSYKLAHTIERDLWSLIRSELQGRTPKYVRVLSPFYDRDLELALRICNEWPSCQIEITAQQNTSTVPCDALAALGKKATLHELRGAGSRRLHAKLCAFEYDKGTLFVAGSANFTTAAFDGINVETCFIWHETTTRFEDLFKDEISRCVISASDFESGKDVAPENRTAATEGEWQLYNAMLTVDNRLQFQFKQPPSGGGSLTAHLFIECNAPPVLAVPVATNARGGGESKLTCDQSVLLRGPVRCELRSGAFGSTIEWLVQEARLTHEVGGGGDRSIERERLIQENGTGLLEKLAELGQLDGLSAVVEYLSRLNIRFRDEDDSSRRHFSVKARDPFRADELPAWLLAGPELAKNYGDAIVEFALRHEHHIFQHHSRRANLGGLANFQDVLLTVTRLLYGAFATGHIEYPQIVGRLCRALEIFGFGFEAENERSDGYVNGLLHNLPSGHTLIVDAFEKNNTMAVIRVVLLTAQRARSKLRHGDSGEPHPLEFAHDKLRRILSALHMKKPERPELEAALRSLQILTPDEINLWLASC